ncbi:hypothetical protein B0H65DRAFT_550320 [Neurospora tetraspora]|uniref:Uncharacterized protein n=1 Tax=Neurospora tetraspora TaxID=94610 RepID=A0AAE0MS86_9PEZI|nr:hypothetical protein B0H65DRAFT_550320 [Neurospora tetraspora]
MSTHTTPLLDRKVLLALVPLASLAASHPHEGNPNANGPLHFSEIAQSIAAATISTQPSFAPAQGSSSSHSTHLTPSLLHGILPNITISTSTSTSTSTDTDPLVIIPVTGTVTDLVNYDTYTIPASLPPLPPPPSATTTTTSGAEQETRTHTVWATVVKQTQVVTVVKTLAPEHTSSMTSSQAWPKGECTGKGDVAVNGKCVPKTMVTSTTRGTKSSTSTSSSVSFTITSPTSTTPPITSTSSKSTPTSTDTDTDPLVIIPVTGTVTDLINYDTYTIPASLPPIPTPLRASASASSSQSSTSALTSDDDPLEIIPVTGTVTDLVDYDTVTLPSATATTVVVIPVSSSSSSSTKSQNVGQMLEHIQGMGQSSRVVVHPTVNVGDRLTVLSGSDGRTTITRASPTATSSTAAGGDDGKVCKEE